MTSVIERAARIASIGINAIVAVSALPKDLHRPVSLYLLSVGCNFPQATAAAIDGTSKQNIGKILRRVEDVSDRPAIEAEIRRLEDLLFG